MKDNVIKWFCFVNYLLNANNQYLSDNFWVGGGGGINVLCQWVAFRYRCQSRSEKIISGGLSEQHVTSLDWPLCCWRQTAEENKSATLNWLTKGCVYSHGAGMFLWMVYAQIRAWDHFWAKSCHHLSAAVLVNNRMWFKVTARKKRFNILCTHFKESRQTAAHIWHAESNFPLFVLQQWGRGVLQATSEGHLIPAKLGLNTNITVSCFLPKAFVISSSELIYFFKYFVHLNSLFFVWLFLFFKQLFKFGSNKLFCRCEWVQNQPVFQRAVYSSSYPSDTRSAWGIEREGKLDENFHLISVHLPFRLFPADSRAGCVCPGRSNLFPRVLLNRTRVRGRV